MKNIALVLSGGGARGMAHIGVIRELEERGYTITSVAGSSIGAMVGAFYATGELDAFARFFTSLSPADVLNLMDLTFSDHGFIKAEKLFKELEKQIPDCLIEELPIPLAITATDIASYEEYVITSGSLYKAVRASVAIPAVITSVCQKGRVLVDGGIINPLPLNRVVRRPGDWLVGVNLYGFAEMSKEKGLRRVKEKNILRSIQHKFVSLRDWKSNLMNAIFSDEKKSYGYMSTLRIIIDVMDQQIASQAIALYKPDLTIPIPITASGVFDFQKAEMLIELGQKIAEQYIDDFESKNFTRKRFVRKSFWCRLLRL